MMYQPSTYNKYDINESNKGKIYSGVNELPAGLSNDVVTKGCICLEGGAFRGLYTTGVLDALMMNGINLECTVGVSAGAMNGICYASGQIGYTGRLNTAYRHNPHYVGLKAKKANGGFIGFDFIFSDPSKDGGVRFDRIKDQHRRFVAVATNCETAETKYFEYPTEEHEKIFKSIQASASMPYISDMVKIDDTPYLDGGCSCKIPYKWAIEQGYEKIVVVRTRDINYRKDIKENSKHLFTRLKYKHYPAFRDSLISNAADYNNEIEELYELEKAGRLFVITPSEALTVGRLEKDVEKLGYIYHLGFNNTVDQLDKLYDYLELKY